MVAKVVAVLVKAAVETKVAGVDPVVLVVDPAVLIPTVVCVVMDALVATALAVAVAVEDTVVVPVVVILDVIVMAQVVLVVVHTLSVVLLSTVKQRQETMVQWDKVVTHLETTLATEMVAQVELLLVMRCKVNGI